MSRKMSVDSLRTVRTLEMMALEVSLESTLLADYSDKSLQVLQTHEWHAVPKRTFGPYQNLACNTNQKITTELINLNLKGFNLKPPGPVQWKQLGFGLQEFQVGFNWTENQLKEPGQSVWDGNSKYDPSIEFGNVSGTSQTYLVSQKNLKPPDPWSGSCLDLSCRDSK